MVFFFHPVMAHRSSVSIQVSPLITSIVIVCILVPGSPRAQIKRPAGSVVESLLPPACSCRLFSDALLVRSTLLAASDHADKQYKLATGETKFNTAKAKKQFDTTADFFGASP